MFDDPCFRDYWYDLTGSKILGDLTSDSYALKDGDATVAIGYVIESYGDVYKRQLDRFFHNSTPLST